MRAGTFIPIISQLAPVRVSSGLWPLRRSFQQISASTYGARSASQPLKRMKKIFFFSCSCRGLAFAFSCTALPGAVPVAVSPRRCVERCAEIPPPPRARRGEHASSRSSSGTLRAEYTSSFAAKCLGSDVTRTVTSVRSVGRGRCLVPLNEVASRARSVQVWQQSQ